MNFKDILQSQKEFFRTQETKDLEFRKKNLQKLKDFLTFK
jgi:aldehyde dehydrogenase (NAD+)